MSLPNINNYGIWNDPITKSLYEEDKWKKINVVNNRFLLLDGSNFLLLDGTNFLLLGT